jgi:hypothetical protein
MRSRAAGLEIVEVTVALTAPDGSAALKLDEPVPRRVRARLRRTG